MGAQAGKDLLIRAADGNGGYVAVAGLRTRQITLNAETVDVTNADSVGRWRELLAGAGMRHASVSGSGVFRDQASDIRLRQMFFDGAVSAFQVVVPAFGTMEGPFQIASLEYRGEHAGEVTFDMSLESAGPISFTAA